MHLELKHLMMIQKSEELEYKTGILKEYVISTAKAEDYRAS